MFLPHSSAAKSANKKNKRAERGGGMFLGPLFGSLAGTRNDFFVFTSFASYPCGFQLLSNMFSMFFSGFLSVSF